MTTRVAVDIGGTFTDAIAIDELGKIKTTKVLTTTGRLADGVIQAINSLAIDPKDISYFVHGTTAGLNAFLERRGAKLALVTTLGFRDVYEIGRASRPEMYNLKFKKPKPLIARRDIFEINERLDADGNVLISIKNDDLEKLVEKLQDYEAVAIVLLHSYKNSIHEKIVLDYLSKSLQYKSIHASHVIAPEWREFERTSTTAISSYIAPIINEYLSDLGEKLQKIKVTPEVKVMQSNGGVMSSKKAKTQPIQTLFSGPVGGTIAGAEIGNQLDLDRLICVDMGGTSFDVSLVVDKKAEIEAQSSLEGHPILAPTVSMNTIGAGGGSIAFTSVGSLKVGPRSAGSLPGPACYGFGGIQATVTDANLFLGRIPQKTLLAGNMELNKDLAINALDIVGKTLGLSTEEIARGVLTIINAAMANAIREITVTRGIDPRDYALVAFGGAGPLHAVEIAEELGIKKVIVPLNPGVLSAWGMLQADSRFDQVLNFYSNLKEINYVEFETKLVKMKESAIEALVNDSILDSTIETQPAADLRYRGQEYTVTVEWPTNWTTKKVLDELGNLFEAEHLIRYGHNNLGEEIELVNIRVSGIGKTRKDSSNYFPTSGNFEDKYEKVSFNFAWHETKIINRENMKINVSYPGPAILVEDGCTTTVPPNWGANVTKFGHIILEKL